MIFKTIWRKDIKLKNLDAYIEIYFDNYTTPRYECSTNFSTKKKWNKYTDFQQYLQRFKLK